LLTKDTKTSEAFYVGRATLPHVKLRSNNREEKGWIVCSKNITEISVTATREKKISQKLTCTDKNVIYCIQCKKM